jgi:hypothetical protein
MTRAADRQTQFQPSSARPETPVFKPVALPALAAAVRASQPQPRHPKIQQLPAILRKEAMLG